MNAAKREFSRSSVLGECSAVELVIVELVTLAFVDALGLTARLSCIDARNSLSGSSVGESVIGGGVRPQDL